MWPRDSLLRDPVTLASALLGSVIRSGEVAIRLTEVEAYDGSNDPGSHAFRGPTPRSAIMFGRPGVAYIYFSYGMHHCLNVVCGPVGTACAVLLRGGQVIEGLEEARSRRNVGRSHPHPDRDLARGPARLASALGVNLHHNGLDLCDPSSMLRLETPSASSGRTIETGPRVGVSGPGGDGATYPWRFWLTGDPTVSTYRPAKPSALRSPHPD